MKCNYYEKLFAQKINFPVHTGACTPQAEPRYKAEHTSRGHTFLTLMPQIFIET